MCQTPIYSSSGESVWQRGSKIVCGIAVFIFVAVGSKHNKKLLSAPEISAVDQPTVGTITSRTVPSKKWAQFEQGLQTPTSDLFQKIHSMCLKIILSGKTPLR
jgi:hypothetical protein